jgi:teichuronic acid biosynthesis glycosyltransferase TuaC
VRGEALNGLGDGTSHRINDRNSEEKSQRIMRVLAVTNTWPDDQAPWRGTWIRDEVDALRSLGVELDIIAIKGYATRLAYATEALRVLKTNRGGRYHVIHAHYGTSGLIARFHLRAPLIVSFLGSDILGPGSVRRGLEAIVLRRVAYLAAATITMSAEMEGRLPARAQARNTIIPHGVDSERFQPRSQTDARRALGWRLDQRVVLFVGTSSAAKGLPLAHEVVEILRAQSEDVVLHWAQRIPHHAMPMVYNASDVLLFPSWSEGSPNAVKEAMASCLPVVATPVGDLPELLDDIDGCFVRPHDPLALAGAVRAALKHGPAPHAREAVQSLSLEAMAKRVLAVYERVAHPSGRESHHVS